MDPTRLTFPPAHCALDRPLGDYYQDFTGALTLVEGGYHGSMSPAGVPRVRLEDGREVEHPITVAQYAIALAGAARSGDGRRRRRLASCAEWLVEHQEAEGERRGFWLHRWDNRKYPWLRDPWVSALAQGNAISALLRAAELLEEPRYADAAGKAYGALHREDEVLPVVVREEGDLWYEEYPARPPLHVLNGHVYALLGVLDWARVSDDDEAHRRWRAAAATAARSLDRFDLGYGSAYDALSREPASVHYHRNIHIPQLRILHALTGDPTFERRATRWEAQLRRPTAALRRAVAGRIRGLRKRLGR